MWQRLRIWLPWRRRLAARIAEMLRTQHDLQQTVTALQAAHYRAVQTALHMGETCTAIRREFEQLRRDHGKLRQDHHRLVVELEALHMRLQLVELGDDLPSATPAETDVLPSPPRTE